MLIAIVVPHGGVFFFFYDLEEHVNQILFSNNLVNSWDFSLNSNVLQNKVNVMLIMVSPKCKTLI